MDCVLKRKGQWLRPLPMMLREVEGEKLQQKSSEAPSVDLSGGPEEKKLKGKKPKEEKPKEEKPKEEKPKRNIKKGRREG